MQAFCFNSVPSITVEWGGARHLGEFIDRYYDERRVLIVTDESLHKSGILEPAKISLESNGFKVVVFDQVVTNPTEVMALDCANKARAAGVNIVIGFGGGSSMDVAKITAVLLASDQKLKDIYGQDNITSKRLPLVQIPTTAGPGSEATNISVLTVGAATRMGVVAQQLFADRVLLDGELTIGLARDQTAATGIDAMVHAIEAYTGKIKKNPVSDAFACEGLKLLADNIVSTYEDGNNKDAREAMLLGAHMAGQAFANSPVGAVHALAHPLCSHYHLPHSLANTLMLVPVLRFNQQAAEKYYAELANMLGVGGQETIAQQSEAFITFIETIIQRTGVPRHLADVGVAYDSLPVLATDAVKQTRLLVNNPINVTETDALELYRQAY